MGGGIFQAMRKHGNSPKDRRRKWLAAFVKLRGQCSWIAVGKRVRWEGRVKGDTYGPGYSGPGFCIIFQCHGQIWLEGLLAA